MKYNERIRALREDLDKKQFELACILDTSQSYYSEYELGKRPLPITHLKTLCLFYNISADYILGLPKNLPWKLNKKSGTKETKEMNEINKETVENIIRWAAEQGFITGDIEILIQNIYEN